MRKEPNGAPVGSQPTQKINQPQSLANKSKPTEQDKENHTASFFLKFGYLTIDVSEPIA